MFSVPKFFPIIFASIVVVLILILFRPYQDNVPSEDSLSGGSYWFVLHRKSNSEDLYFGTPGNREESELVRTFAIKPGVPGESPTPLPQLLGKEYWLITDEWEEIENTETGPYFLLLNIDAPSDQPYGPVPYDECNGQCDWGKPGYFGLHGTGGDPSRLAESDPGSSGCVRHKDEDIAYLYELLDPKNSEIRYYVEDN